ncbi:hypothetical protein SAMN04490244_101444 [Tranquillimonas rosea]|uniref:Lipoprotein n=1 Tax=Tranquillimonas rosea TaxID=641238 RepID=A0A1H9Q2N4_9RHOB|nr:hypothetical protein [Tranquillimonas rosea]SER54717.1 hypothetical protein SAMN04490244_101444 [Tranquillimonas rosea]
MGRGTAVLVLMAGVAACAETTPPAEAPAPEYLGVQTRLLGGDLVNFLVEMRGASSAGDVTAYADCAAAQYARIRDYGFARRVRTNLDEEGGLWRGDAVYTVSPALPEGTRTIDADVVVAACREDGIPTV